MKAIRGATSVEKNEREEIVARTIELIEKILTNNDIWEIHSVIFTVTRDLTAFNPATAFRERFDYNDVALLCINEADFQGSLNGIIRVLIHCESTSKNFVYLHRARNLRPDLVFNDEDNP